MANLDETPTEDATTEETLYWRRGKYTRREVPDDMVPDIMIVEAVSVDTGMVMFRGSAADFDNNFVASR